MLRRLGAALADLGLSSGAAFRRLRSRETFAAANETPRGLVDALETALSQVTDIVTGRVHLIDITAVHARKGGRSNEAIYGIVEGCIRRHMTNGDVLARIDDSNYVVVFRRLSPEESQVCCSLVAQEISRRLFGEGEMPCVSIRSVVSDGNKKITFVPVESNAVMETGIKSRHVVVPPMPGNNMPPSLQPSHENDVSQPNTSEVFVSSGNHGIKGDEATLVDTICALTEQFDCIDAKGRANRTVPPSTYQPINLAGGDLPVAFADAGHSVKFEYRPVWNIDSAAVASYLASLTILSGLDRIRPSQFVTGVGPRLMEAVDRLVLKCVIADLDASASVSRQFLTIIPVHCSTVSHAGYRQEYLELCAAAAETHRAQLVWEIRAPSAGLLNSQLLPAVASLRHHGRAVIICGNLPSFVFRELSAYKVHAVGLDLEDIALVERDAIRECERFSARASDTGMKTFLHGCSTRSMTSAAVGAGFSYLDGDAVALPVQAPGALSRFHLRDLYQVPTRASLSPGAPS